MASAASAPARRALAMSSPSWSRWLSCGITFSQVVPTAYGSGRTACHAPAGLLEVEDALRIAAAHRFALSGGERVHPGEAALHVADIVRVVGAVHDPVGTA